MNKIYENIDDSALVVVLFYYSNIRLLYQSSKKKKCLTNFRHVPSHGTASYYIYKYKIIHRKSFKKSK